MTLANEIVKFINHMKDENAIYIKNKKKKNLSFNKLEYLTKYFNKNKITDIYNLKNHQCKIINSHKICEYDVRKCHETSSFYFIKQNKYLCWRHSYSIVL